jgi:subtilisin
MAASPLSAGSSELLRTLVQDARTPLVTGRSVVTFKDGGYAAGMDDLRKTHGATLVADARDFPGQAVTFQTLTDAQVIGFPEIEVAVVTGEAAVTHNLMPRAAIAPDSPIRSIDPEHFAFPSQVAVRFQASPQHTWNLIACEVPRSPFIGSGIRVAVIDTGFDLAHPEFADRPIVAHSFVGGSVHSPLGHGTLVAGIACGPVIATPPHPRYGIAHGAEIFIGKVVDNSGDSTQALVLAGMNWAIANRCAVINVSLGEDIPEQPSYTQAGQRALDAGCLIVASAGNFSVRPFVIKHAGAPANSPTIVSVASLDCTLEVAKSSAGHKIDLAAPGVEILSAAPRPKLHATGFGTSMAAPHVAGCAALWASSNPNLRGVQLRHALIASAKPLPLPARDVGAGLVQAP